MPTGASGIERSVCPNEENQWTTPFASERTNFVGIKERFTCFRGYPKAVRLTYFDHVLTVSRTLH